MEKLIQIETSLDKLQFERGTGKLCCEVMPHQIRSSLLPRLSTPRSSSDLDAHGDHRQLVSGQAAFVDVQVEQWEDYGQLLTAQYQRIGGLSVNVLITVSAKQRQIDSAAGISASTIRPVFA